MLSLFYVWFCRLGSSQFFKSLLLPKKTFFNNLLKKAFKSQFLKIITLSCCQLSPLTPLITWFLSLPKHLSLCSSKKYFFLIFKIFSSRMDEIQNVLADREKLHLRRIPKPLTDSEGDFDRNGLIVTSWEKSFCLTNARKPVLSQSI